MVDWITALGDLAIFSFRTLGWLLTRRPPKGTLLPNFYQVGVLSLPVVALTGTFIGMVLAVQSYCQFAHDGPGDAAGLGDQHLAGQGAGPGAGGDDARRPGRLRHGAELGTMRVTEQIDALAGLGTNPIHYLVVPRFLACFLLIPLLTLMADFMGVIGGAVV